MFVCVFVECFEMRSDKPKTSRIKCRIIRKKKQENEPNCLL